MPGGTWWLCLIKKFLAGEEAVDPLTSGHGPSLPDLEANHHGGCALLLELAAVITIASMQDPKSNAQNGNVS
ncbi:hypothetical protein BSKO_03966 [Bryopsis sp. KO-2023]|nr:hypothetical protein BSKO_03966 [Bryopsis sp. KO-2023]